MKISTTKQQQNKGKSNIKTIKCQLSKEYIFDPNKAVCINIKSNNTAYISKEYLQHKVFENLEITNNYKIDILTLAVLGAKITNCNNQISLSINDYTKATATYSILLKNNLLIEIFDNDAKAKKYFNILKNYKSSIQKIVYSIIRLNKIDFCSVEDLQHYPPFEKKLKLYHLGLSYNPLSKNDCIINW